MQIYLVHKYGFGTTAGAEDPRAETAQPSGSRSCGSQDSGGAPWGSQGDGVYESCRNIRVQPGDGLIWKSAAGICLYMPDASAAAEARCFRRENGANGFDRQDCGEMCGPIQGSSGPIGEPVFSWCKSRQSDLLVRQTKGFETAQAVAGQAGSGCGVWLEMAGGAGSRRVPGGSHRRMGRRRGAGDRHGAMAIRHHGGGGRMGRGEAVGIPGRP